MLCVRSPFVLLHTAVRCPASPAELEFAASAYQRASCQLTIHECHRNMRPHWNGSAGLTMVLLTLHFVATVVERILHDRNTTSRTRTFPRKLLDFFFG